MDAGLAILCYHRIVGDADVDAAWPYLERGTCVRMSTFRAHVDDAWVFADIVTESKALDVLAGRCRLSRPAVWLTFDDGYRDVLAAIPIAPTGTAFVATGVQRNPLPADAWYAVLLGARRCCGVLDLGHGMFTYDLRVREGRSRLVNGPERRAFLRSTPDVQATTLDQLATYLDSPGEFSHCYMDDSELMSLKACGWSVGSHGVAHTPFDMLDPNAIDCDVRKSIVHLTSLGLRVRSLALPDGSLPSNPGMLRDAGFESVLGLGNALAEPGAFVSSRFIVPDDPGWVRTTLRQVFS